MALQHGVYFHTLRFLRTWITSASWAGSVAVATSWSSVIFFFSASDKLCRCVFIAHDSLSKMRKPGKDKTTLLTAVHLYFWGNVSIRVTRFPMAFLLSRNYSPKIMNNPFKVFSYEYLSYHLFPPEIWLLPDNSVFIIGYWSVSCLNGIERMRHVTFDHTGARNYLVMFMFKEFFSHFTWADIRLYKLTANSRR